MAAYVRPELPTLVLRDASGAVIEHGNRWDGGSPPDDAYGVAEHPERWAPVVLVADALIAHLVAVYDVEVTHDPAPDEGVSTTAGLDVVRRTRLTPVDPRSAPIEVVVTSGPAVHVRSGLTHMSGYPGCGCDACDDPLEEVIEELESHVLTVVSGRFSERFRGSTVPGLLSAVRTTFVEPDGTGVRVSEHVLTRLPRRDRVALRRRLAPVRGGWEPWRFRGGSAMAPEVPGGAP